jgi:hypothetical protein
LISSPINNFEINGNISSLAFFAGMSLSILKLL